MEANKMMTPEELEIRTLKIRLRHTSQILLAEVDASGPAPTEEIAKDAVKLIRELKTRLAFYLAVDGEDVP